MKKGTTLLRTLLLGLLGTMLGTMDVWAAEAYVYVADNDQTTLHFYNDNQRSARNSTGITYDLNGGQVRPTWTSASDYQETITTVEFHDEITPTTTYMWFAYYRNLTTIKQFYLLNTSQVTCMDMMFYECASLKSLNFFSYDPTIPGKVNITNTDYFSTANVTSMDGMFRKCTGLTTLNLSGWYANSLTNTRYMFEGCSNLKDLTLGREAIDGYNSGWKTTGVTNMEHMFDGCSSLKTIYVGYDFTVAGVTNSASMFLGCTSLQGGAGTTYNINNIDKGYAHVDGGTRNPGYFHQESTPSYAVLSADKTKLTFYCDWTKTLKDGTFYRFDGSEYPGWYSAHETITTVEFDASFNAARPRSTSGWFRDMSNLTEDKIIGLRYLNTSLTIYMSHMFEGCKKLKFLYLNTFDTKNVTEFDMMFYGCSNLEFVDVCSFKTSGAYTMSYMFAACTKLKVLDLSSFSTASCHLISYMFQGCTSLQTIHVGSAWNANNVSTGESVFMGCSSLVGGNGTIYSNSNMDKAYARIDASGAPGYFTKSAPYAVYNEGTLTFYNDGKINDRQGSKYTIYENPVSNNDYIYTGVHADGNYQNVTKVIFNAPLDPAPYCKLYGGNANSFYWFYKMENLTTIGPMGYFDTSNLESMSNMFYNCKSLTSLNLNYFDTNKATNMSYMFFHCESLTSLDLGTFNTKNVARCLYMFAGCSNLKYILVGEDWNVQSLQYSNSQYMFNGCTNLVGGAGTACTGGRYEDREYAIIDGGTSSPGYLSASPYVVLSADKTKLTFYNDGKRKEKTGGTTYSLGAWAAATIANVTTVTFDQSFRTARPLSTANWFYLASKLSAINGIGYLNTSEVTTMESMFRGCESLTSLDLSGFNTSQVTDMGNMFKNCSGITLLDLTSFNTANVTNMRSMFSGDSLLTTIFISSKWKTNKVTSSYNGSYMFEGCTVLKGGAGTACDGLSNIGKTYARADNADAPGYLSYKPYAVYHEAAHVLAFYADGRPDVKIGTVYDLKRGAYAPGWYSDGNYANVQVVEFDASFANARPLTTYYWFYKMTNLKTIRDIENLNTEEVKSMMGMFYFCSALEMLNLSRFNTSKVTTMSYMFRECSNLKTVYVSDEWTTNKVTGSDYMFTNCTAIVGGNGTKYNSGKTNKEYARIDAADAPGYFTAGPPAYAVLSGNTLTLYADGNPTEKTGIKYDIPRDIDRVDPDWHSNETITKVVFDPSFAAARPTSTYGWFLDLENLTTIEGIEYLNTSKVTTMQNMFRNTKLTTIDLSNFNTANVRDMFGMFVENPELTTIWVGKNWTVENLSSIYQIMFDDCPKLVGGAGTTWNPDSIYAAYAHIDGGPDNPGYFSVMPYAVYDENTLTFYADGHKNSKIGTIYSLNQGSNSPDWYTDETCGSVTSVVFDPSFANVRPTTTKSWFAGMTNLVGIEGLEYLNTSEVTNMESMFSLCRSLESIDVSGFDTQKVTTMNSMFNECNALKTLDLTSFNVRKVTDMQNMFSGCTSLTTIYTESNWNRGFSGNSSFMFTNCPSLVGGAGTKWNASFSNNIAFAHIDDINAPGYFTQGPAYMLGDVNHDWQVSVADVTALVNMLKADNVEYSKNADIDGDGSITDIDTKALVYQILGSHALMYVEDVFTLSTSGRTVATGQILKGMFRTGQPIVLRSISDATPDVEFALSGIEMFRKAVEMAGAGDGVGIVVDVAKESVQRGDVLTIKDNPDLRHSKTVKGRLYLLTKAEGGRHTPIQLGYQPQMYAGGVAFSAQITNLGTVGGQAATMIMPGSTSENVELTVTEEGKTPYVYPGQVVPLREGGRTIGRLTITE